MLGDPVVASMIALALLAVGEVVSIATRARVPMLLVILLGYLLLLWTGVMPKTVLTSSTFPVIGAVMTAPLIVHMGTLIPLKTIKKQWQAVVINLIGLVIAVGLVLVVGTVVLGYQTAAASVGPSVGGTIAFLVTSAKLKELGLENLVALPALVLAFHSLVGMPLAANFLGRYARKFKQSIETESLIASTVEANVVPSALQVKVKSAPRFLIPEKYSTNVISLFQLFIGAALAVILGKYTGINFSLWCLVIGLVGSLLGFYRDKMLERANSFGLAMVGLIVMILPSMNTVTFSMFLGFLPAVALIIALSVIGLIAGGYIGSKLFNWDVNKGIPIALTSTFGFPGDYMICEEVSRSEGKDEVQKQRILDETLPPMLVGGFTSVTIASIAIASIVMGTLK